MSRELCHTCFSAPRQLRSIRRSVSQPVLLSLVMSLILTRLDFGSATLSGVPGYLLSRLQSVLNAAACLVTQVRKYHQVTHLLRDLHWLRIPERIHYRLAVLGCRCRHNMVPLYLACHLNWTDKAEALQCLRSGSRQRLIMPRTQLHMIGIRSFRVTAARAWNSLHLVSFQHLHWLCSKDNWKHSCLITLFVTIYFNYVPVPYFAYATLIFMFL